MYQPRFTITPQLNTQIAQIEKFRQIAENSRIIPQQQILLRHRAMQESVHSSTSIEGNPLNQQEVVNVLSGKRVTALEQSIREVINYKQALDWVEKHLELKQSLALQDTFALHALVVAGLLPPEKTGRIRPGAVYIVDEINEVEVLQYTGPAAQIVPGLLKELFSWISQGSQLHHPVLLAGVLHFAFLAIHPFSDGNGRVTRLLTKLLLSQQGYAFKGALVLDTYYAQNRLAYYQALSLGKTYQERKTADITSWLEYFVAGMSMEVESLAEEMSVASLTTGTSSVVLSKEEIAMLSFVRQFGAISLAEAKEIVAGTERTAQRRLKKLVDEGFLRQIGQARKTSYVFH